jgi:hypothetical protein
LKNPFENVSPGMRRATVVGSIIVIGVIAAVVAALVRSGGSGDKKVQTVAGQKITRDDLDLAVEHFHEEGDREGRPFPDKGSKEYERVQKIALGLLIDRAAIEGAAADLRVHVTEKQVGARLGNAGSGENEGGDIRVKAEAAFARGTARTQLLEEAVSRKLTAGLTVSAAAVRAYYRAHRGIYGSTPFAQLQASIRDQLLAQRRNAVLAAWLAKVRRGEPKPKLE